MPTSRPTGTKNETIRCENCGEYYSVTYKRCPFCEEYAAEQTTRRRRPQAEQPEETDPPRHSRHREPVYEEPDDRFDDEYEDDYEDEIPNNRAGGKHLVTNTRGGGYGGRISPMRIIGGVLSLALIGAAIFIVVTIVRPFLKEKPAEPTPAPTPPVSTVAPTAAPSATPGTPALPGDPGAPEVVPSAGPSTTPPPGQTATAFSIGKGDITLSDTWPTHIFKVTFTPAGSKGSITWSSSKPEIVTVDQSGKVTPVKQGNATITATMAGGYTATCIVRNNVGAGAEQPATSEKPAASPKPSAPAAAGLTLNHTDFTMHVGEAAVKLKVVGTSSAPGWSAKDSGIAKVSENGSVTAVAKGTTKIIAEVDGKKLECIVRVLP
ncbi:MAG: Ig-like domain-containing protein [Pseudoflavonifractor sp.]